jgi:hypothetical protein
VTRWIGALGPSLAESLSLSRLLVHPIVSNSCALARECCGLLSKVKAGEVA